MKTITIQIDAAKLGNWNNFHSYFKEMFGFPEFYGNNMNAWIDCMTYLDESEGGMSTKVSVNKGECIVLQLLNVDLLKQTSMEVYIALLECSAFVNYRRMETGDNPLTILSF